MRGRQTLTRSSRSGAECRERLSCGKTKKQNKNEVTGKARLQCPVMQHTRSAQAMLYMRA